MNLKESGKIKISQAGDWPGNQLSQDGHDPSNEWYIGGTPGLLASIYTVGE